MQFSAVNLLPAVLAGFLALPAQANVVVNGTFDDTTSGWSGDIYGLRDASPTITTGNYLFFGSGASHQIEQTYTLEPGEASDADAGELFYTLSADLFSWFQQNDVATLTANFLDIADGNLGSVSLSNPAPAGGGWGGALTAGSAETFQSVSGMVPLLTRSISIQIAGLRTAGTNNDSYADNVSLSLGPAAVPLPAGAALLLGGLAALGMTRRRA